MPDLQDLGRTFFVLVPSVDSSIEHAVVVGHGDVRLEPGNLRLKASHATVRRYLERLGVV